MAFTSQLNNSILNHVFRNEPYTPPSSVYVALFTSSNTEVSGDGYERKQITFSAPINNEIANDEEVRFPIAMSDWGTITHLAIFDSETGGNMLDLAEIEAESQRIVRENDQPIVGVGDYKVELR